MTITINGHSWKSRVAIMRGRYLLGLSNANRQAAGVVTGDEAKVEVEQDEREAQKVCKRRCTRSSTQEEIWCR